MNKNTGLLQIKLERRLKNELETITQRIVNDFENGMLAVTSQKFSYQDLTIPIISNVDVYGLEKSIKASGYPKKKSIVDAMESSSVEELSENDKKRAKLLGKVPCGSGHDCYLKGITVQFDVCLSEKVWPQIERYSFLDIISSMSTMHMLTKMTPVFNENTDKSVIVVFMRVLSEYVSDPSDKNRLRVLYSYPSGLVLMARVTTNYLQLKTIYYQRRNHFLPEWHDFCRWIETLPMFETLVLQECD